MFHWSNFWANSLDSEPLLTTCDQADINDYLSDMSIEDFKTGFMILVDNNLDRQINAKSFNNKFTNNQNLSEFQVLIFLFKLSF